MNRTEAGILLTYIARNDHRTWGEDDAADFADLLDNISLGDAMIVTREYRRTETAWLTPAIIRQRVKGLHADRLENFVYVPTPGETGAEFIERFDRQRDAVAAGEIPPVPSITQALKPRPVAALVAGVAEARSLPPEIANVIAKRRHGARSIPCPACEARADAPCRAPSRGPSGRRDLKNLHPSRIATWAIREAACPLCSAAPGDKCREYGQEKRDGVHADRIRAAGGDADHAA